MSILSYRTVQTARLSQRFAEDGAGPPVILLHGFPEGAYSWRKQLPALAQAGFRAIAPDQRGYFGTSAAANAATATATNAIDRYDHVELAADVIALMDTLGIERAPVVAHDWGAALAWNLALLHPERVSAVVALSVPFGGRSPKPPVATLKQRFGDTFFYMLYFQTPGVAEAELERDVRESLRKFYFTSSGDAPSGSFFVPQPRTAKLFDAMTAPPGLPAWLTEHDLDVYASAFTASGFGGPLNWYRTMDRTWERTAHLAGAKVEQPTLFISGEKDPVAMFSQGAMARMPSLVPRLEPMISFHNRAKIPGSDGSSPARGRRGPAGTGAEHPDVVRDAFPGGAARDRLGIGRALYSAEPARVSGCASLALDVTGPPGRAT